MNDGSVSIKVTLESAEAEARAKALRASLDGIEDTAKKTDLETPLKKGAEASKAAAAGADSVASSTGKADTRIKAMAQSITSKASNAMKVFSRNVDEAYGGTDILKTKLTAMCEKGKAGLTAMGSAASKVAKVGLAAIAAQAAAAALAVVKLGQQALDAYASYEQLVGGVETLFGAGGQSLEEYAAQQGKSVSKVKGKYEELMKSQRMVLEDADAAYKTAGLSANDYMETVTSFSATMISAVGGDTVKAAQLSNQAVIDMSDNANKMGTSMEEIQRAYQSMARGNYAMLDSLKLGYGGTKAEMERMLADAEALTGKKYDISNFADVTEAIHAIQTQWGITGTTAKEASTTIEGSVNSMRAAWTNWLTEIGKSDADIEGSTAKMVDAVVVAASNVIPRAAEIGANLVTALVSQLPTLGEKVQASLEANDLGGKFQQTFEKAGQMVASIDWGAVLSTALGAILTGVANLLSGVGSYLSANGGQILAAVGALLLRAAATIVANIPQIVVAVGSLLNGAIDAVLGFAGQIALAFAKLIVRAGQAIGQNANKVITAVKKAVTDSINGALQSVGKFAEGGRKLITSLADGIKAKASNVINNAKTAASNAAKGALQKAGQFLSAGKQLAGNLASGVKALGSKVSSAAKGVITAAKTAVSGAVKKFTEVGSNIVKGIWEGITGGASWIADKVTGFANNLLTTAKNALGIHSPSKKARDEIGKNYALGVAEGISKNASVAINASEDLSKKLITAAEKRVKELKKQNKLTEADEVQFWEAIKATAKKGSDAYKQAADKVKEAKKQLKADIKEAADAYKESVADIQANLKEQLQALSDTYAEALESTKQSILGGFSLFDEYVAESDASIGTLIGNLRSQTEAAQDYAEQLETLRRRLADNPSLFDEIVSKGVDALPEIKAINAASEAELETYCKLYEERAAAASAAAKTANEKLYQETQDSMAALTAKAAEDIGKAYSDLQKKLEKLGATVPKNIKKSFKSTTESIKSELASMQQVVEGYAAEYAKVFDRDIVATTAEYATQTTSALQAAAEAAQAASEAITEAVMGGSEETAENLASTGEVVQQTVTSNAEQVKATVAQTIADNQNAITQAGIVVNQGVQNICSSALASIQSACSSAVSAVSSAVASINAMWASAATGPTGGSSSGSKTSSKTTSTSSKAKVATSAVKWNATGGIYNKASIIGLAENGKEAAIPLEGRHMQPFAGAIAENLNMDEVVRAIYMLTSALPGIIKKNTPDSISVNKREFGRLVREV